MRIPIYWTSYRFAEEPLSESGFISAHLYPRQIRRAYWQSLLKQAPVPTLRAVALFFMAVIATNYFNSDTPHDAGFAEGALILIGCYLIVSFALSTLSFVGYIISVMSFWERQLSEARHHDDFDKFRHALIHGREPEQQSWAPVIAIGVLCLAGFVVFVAFMFGGTPAAAKGAQTPSAQQASVPVNSRDREPTSPMHDTAATDRQSHSKAPEPIPRDSLVCLDVPGMRDCLKFLVKAPSLTSEEERRQQLPGATAFHLFEPAGRMTPSSAPTEQQIHHGIEEAILEARDLLRDYRLPASLTIDTQPCRTGASYALGTHRISLCARFVRRLYTEALANGTVADALDHARDGARFAIAHEVGHALIDMYGLPVLGREEDAADQFAAFVFLEHDRPLPVLAMEEHYRRAREYRLTAEDFGDSHAVGPQRLANLSCWLYGADTAEFSFLGDELPRGRRDGCHAEYGRLRASWSALLGPLLSH